MPFRKLGQSGISVSLFSFGSWVTFGKQLDNDLSKECIKYAFDNGVNFFDNAEVYALGKSETLMGEAFRQLGIGRNEYVLTTKFFWGIEQRVNFKNTLNRKYLMQAIDGSLKRLNTDFVDVAYCHRYDPETPKTNAAHPSPSLAQSHHAPAPNSANKPRTAHQTARNPPRNPCKPPSRQSAPPFHPTHSRTVAPPKPPRFPAPRS